MSCVGKSREQQENAAQFRDEIAKKMTPQQIAEAHRLAWEWKSKQTKNTIH
jgi:hypothetical protein